MLLTFLRVSEWTLLWTTLGHSHLLYLLSKILSSHFQLHLANFTSFFMPPFKYSFFRKTFPEVQNYVSSTCFIYICVCVHMYIHIPIATIFIDLYLLHFWHLFELCPPPSILFITVSPTSEEFPIHNMCLVLVKSAYVTKISVFVFELIILWSYKTLFVCQHIKHHNIPMKTKKTSLHVFSSASVN